MIKQKIYLLLVLGTFDIYSFEFSFLENYKKLISFSCATLLTLPILYKIYKIKQEIKKEEYLKNPEYKNALKESYLIFKSRIFNYKKYLKTKNEEIAKLIKCRKLLPEELEPSIGLELDHLINKNDLSSQILTKLAKIERRII